MDIRFVASVAVITTDPARDTALFGGTLGIAMTSPVSIGESDYVYTEDLDGAKHFGVWPLSEAAEVCFGTTQWPDTHPVPQGCIEFEVDDVEAASKELEAAGHQLLHEVRTEPWGQVNVHFQAADGMIVGLSFTPHLREG